MSQNGIFICPRVHCLWVSHKRNTLTLCLSIWHDRPHVTPHELLALFLGVWTCYNHHSTPVSQNTDGLNGCIFTPFQCKSLIYKDVAAMVLLWKPWIQTKEKQRGWFTASEKHFFPLCLFQSNVTHWRGWTENISQANVSCGSNNRRLSESRAWDPLLMKIMKEKIHTPGIWRRASGLICLRKHSFFWSSIFN